jgi:hypothetical protein
MIAVCAAATALITAGILVGGGLGKFLIILGLLGNHTWLAATFVRWWRQAPDTHRRIMLAATGAYLLGWVVLRTVAGPFAAWALGLAGLGFFGLMGAVFLTTGYLTVRHGRREQAAIAAIEATRHRRELSR